MSEIWTEKYRPQEFSDIAGQEEIIKLAKIARKIENVYGTPQDIEFAVKDDEIFILQSRPITT